MKNMKFVFFIFFLVPQQKNKSKQTNKQKTLYNTMYIRLCTIYLSAMNKKQL